MSLHLICLFVVRLAGFGFGLRTAKTEAFFCAQKILKFTTEFKFWVIYSTLEAMEAFLSALDL